MLSTEDLFRRYGPVYRWLATVTVMVAAIAVVLSSTIVNVAIPSVMGYFGMAATKAQYLSTGYLAATTATMLMVDWSMRRFGIRMTMIASLVLFTAGSLIGATAPDENLLIFGRVLQGAAAGIVQPLSMVMMFLVFPPGQRGTATGIYGIGVVLAPALGPWIGGVLMDAFNWRFIFYLGLPFAVIGIVAAYLFLPTERAEPANAPKFDWTGFVLLCLSLGIGLNGMSNGQREGWTSDPILLQFTLAIVALVAFILWERRTPKPLLDLKLFAVFPFTAASIVSFVIGAGLFGSTYLLPLFVQTIQGMTPTDAGLLLMPSGFVLVVIFPIAGRLSDRLEPGVLIGVGLIVFCYACWLTASADINTSFGDLAYWTALTRVGLGLLFPALTAGSLRVLPKELLAQGSGAVNFTRQLGGALGTNLLAVILERRTAFHADALMSTQQMSNHATLEYIAEMTRIIGHAGLAAWQQLDAATLYIGQVVVPQATTMAYRDGFLITAAVFAFALLPTLVLQRAISRAARKARKGAPASA
jgi:EmrB/QacA subfamily drug resistance transporter